MNFYIIYAICSKIEVDMFLPVSIEEVKKLGWDYIDIIIKQIAKEILRGKIDLKPYNKNGKTPCEYCEYKTVCGFNTKQNNNEYNYINKKSKDDIIKKMKEQLGKNNGRNQ